MPVPSFMAEDLRCCACGNTDPEKFKVKYQKENFAVLTCDVCSMHFIPPFYRKKITYTQYKNEAVTQAVRAGNTVYVRGQVGTDFDGNLVGLGDPQAQAEQAMKNVKQLLEEAGSDLSHVVKTTTYLIDPRYREAVYQEVGTWLKGVFPISTGLVVSALGQPQWLMEIDVIAVIPDGWKPNQA